MFKIVKGPIFPGTSYRLILQETSLNTNTVPLSTVFIQNKVLYKDNTTNSTPFKERKALL